VRGYLLALVCASALLAWALARGWLTRGMWPFYRPVALLLTWTSAADMLRLPLQLPPTIDPYTGTARATFHVDQALLLSWPAALIAASFVIFLRRPPWLVAAGWALGSLAFATAYPWLRDGNLFAAYAAFSLATCVAIWAIALSRLGEAWIQHHVSLLLIMAGEAIANVAYLVGDPVRNWNVARAAHTTAFGILLCYQIAQIMRYWRWRKL
jgi:hypothetical protein